MRVPRSSVVDVLTRMGQAMRALGDHHRTRAYLNAANAVERTEDFEALYDAGKLRSISGIGEAIEKKIVAFVERGEVPKWLDDPSAAPARVGDQDSAVTRARADAAEGVRGVPRSFREAPFQGAPDLHCHTTWSDGTLTLEEVVVFARMLGATSVGISDHSGSLHIARGLKPHEVRAQWAEIDRLQARFDDMIILKGTETDILRDGRLDHPRDVLEGFDYVIGSLHSQLKLPLAEQTARVLKALEDPCLTVLGHPTTRVPGRRPRANLDLAKVFETAALREVALEVNGNPGRIDLDAQLALQALQAGAKLSLGSDGHSAWEMLSLEKARRIAAEAGAREEDLVNYDVLRRARDQRSASPTPRS